MSLKETVMKYYDLKANYSCSESMLRGLNEYYDLKFSEDILIASGANSRGSFSGYCCGALNSCFEYLALKYSNGRTHESPLMKEKIIEFNEIVTKDLGGGSCTILRDKYYKPEERCSYIVKRIAELFEEYLDKQ